MTTPLSPESDQLRLYCGATAYVVVDAILAWVDGGGGGVKEASLRQHEIAHAVLNGPACLV